MIAEQVPFKADVSVEVVVAENADDGRRGTDSVQVTVQVDLVNVFHVQAELMRVLDEVRTREKRMDQWNITQRTVETKMRRLLAIYGEIMVSMVRFWHHLPDITDVYPFKV
jgi:hypothetical protein